MGEKKATECLSHGQVNIQTIFTTLKDTGQEAMSTERYLSCLEVAHKIGENFKHDHHSL